MKSYIKTTIGALFLFITIYSATYASMWAMIVWWDSDSYGCIWSAWYSWSQKLNQCVRPRELYSMDVSYPTTHNKKLDTTIKQYINKTQSAFISEAEDIILEDTENNDTRNWKPELVIGYTIHNYDTGGIISIEFNTYEYLWWAHGMTTIKTINYNTITKQIITLPQLLRKHKINLKTISHTIIPYFANKLWSGNVDSDWIKGWLSPILSNYKNFSINASGDNITSITFMFEQYQIASYADGVQSVTLLYPSIKIQNNK